MRKSIFKIILLAFSMMLVSSPAHAIQDENVYLIVKSTNRENDPIDKNNRGNRSQPKNIECVITQDGLTIPGYDVEEILSYEIFTVDGDPVAVFTEEEDFISFIFSATGAYEIRLQFEEITLTGIINL